MKVLIISEKAIAAKRIAEMLSNKKNTSKKVGSIPTYHFTVDGSEYTCFGLKGHILKVDFPSAYSNWQNIDPAQLIDAELIKIPTHKGLVSLLKKEAKQADKVIIATDFDREGELIGVDALNQIKASNPDVEIKRARFSALTAKEIDHAFANLDDPDYALAQAGEARQDIDLIWGATLTRFISLSSMRLGRQFLSVGRVQSPTLNLIVLREHERNAFISEPYWQLKARAKHGNEEFVVVHKAEKFWDKKEVDKAVANIGDEAVAVNVKKTEKSLAPPAPFNTTSFLAAAANQGLSPANAMRIAEGLYMKGFISYPRVDNTVYPKTLGFRDILTSLESTAQLGSLAKKINAQANLEPTRGKKMATDHPPIHPTAALAKDAVSEQDWKIYELIVRRFLATLAPKAKMASVRIDFDANGELLFIRGSQTKSPGWLEFYPYGKRKDNPVPDINKGDEVKIVEIIIEDKETQPPARYSQSSLIQKMEELNLGTKATRHNIIKNLYDRGYTHNDPVIPTDLGIAVADTLNKYANKISSPGMTAELEDEMSSIAKGSSNQEEVVDRSRRILAKTLTDLSAKKEEVGQQIRAGILESQTLGKCPNSDGNLRIIRSKKTRKRFVGCSDYPDCKTTFPLPQYGEIIPLGEVCPECGSPKIKVISKGKRPWSICIDPNCVTKEEYKKSKKMKK